MDTNEHEWFWEGLWGRVSVERAVGQGGGENHEWTRMNTNGVEEGRWGRGEREPRMGKSQGVS